ncbi:extracellular solute-binding protein [Microbacterium azadirachtae]|uniref:Carbohydrate ABC transporter substrate-binding protein, CUT1 family n=1 Tax=Microbacterium azadirachtae TaxID=582680 RepID=A0A1I6I664_9MICO|nr:extracellular solute-binding protein [Microbacterium azadirachtae]SFR62124.1 carbohydrate ABC transporter substrate-binding protein, CUT1 family [Microbacterium azadirachtae]
MTPPLDLNRRQFLGAAGLAAGTALLAGCAPSASAAGTRPLQFWHLLSGGDGVTMSGLLDAVNSAQADYRIRPTVLAWGTPYYTKLAMAAAGGRAPDVAIMHATRVLGWAPGGLLDAWDTGRLADLGVDASTFPDPIWKKGEVDGKRLSIALDAHPFVLMYNTDVCRKAGVLGADGRLKEAKSPDEFLAMVDAIAGVTGGHGLSYGYLGDGSQMWRLFYTLYTQHGIEMAMPQGGSAVIDKDAAVASLAFMQKLLDGKRAAKQADYGTAVAEFATGKSGMFLSGVWELRTMQAAKIPFDIAMIPPLFGTRTAYADSHSFVLPHQSHPDPASRDLVYRFVADMLKGSFGWAEAGHIPAYLPVTGSPQYADLLPQAHYAEAAGYVRYDPPAWFTGSGSNFQGQFGAAAQPALLGGGSPADAIARFEEAVARFQAQPNPADPEGARR